LVNAAEQICYPVYNLVKFFVFPAMDIFIFGFIKSPSPFGKFIQGGVNIAAQNKSRLKIAYLGGKLL
jgi:hypothetical protein